MKRVTAWLGLLSLLFCNLNAVGQALPEQAMRRIDALTNPTEVLEESSNRIQHLSAGRTRIFSGANRIRVVDFDAEGRQQQAQVLDNARVDFFDRDYFVPVGDDTVLAYPVANGCRVTRLGADLRIVYQRDVVLQNNRSEAKGLPLCRSAVLGDGRVIVGDYGSTVGLVAANGRGHTSRTPMH